eukprot:5450081-Pleurochrysis_carterae.AAC.1
MSPIRTKAHSMCQLSRTRSQDTAPTEGNESSDPHSRHSSTEHARPVKEQVRASHLHTHAQDGSGQGCACEQGLEAGPLGQRHTEFGRDPHPPPRHNAVDCSISDLRALRCASPSLGDPAVPVAVSPNRVGRSSQSPAHALAASSLTSHGARVYVSVLIACTHTRVSRLGARASAVGGEQGEAAGDDAEQVPRAHQHRGDVRARHGELPQGVHQARARA